MLINTYIRFLSENKKRGPTFTSQCLFRHQTVTHYQLSGYLDSNQGLPAPKAGALTGLRYTPIERQTGLGPATFGLGSQRSTD